MFDHSILSDEEREALNEVMLAPASQSPHRVLIVDDDKDAREVLAEILSLNDISCITAAGGTVGPLRFAVVYNDTAAASPWSATATTARASPSTTARP